MIAAAVATPRPDVCAPRRCRAGRAPPRAGRGAGRRDARREARARRSPRSRRPPVAELYIDRLESRWRTTSARSSSRARPARASSSRRCCRCWVALLNLHGRLEEAAAVLDGAIEGARLARNRDALAWALYHRAHAALDAGDLETARPPAQESLDAHARPRRQRGLLLRRGRSSAGRGWRAASPARGVELMVEPRRRGGPAAHRRPPGARSTWRSRSPAGWRSGAARRPSARRRSPTTSRRAPTCGSPRSPPPGRGPARARRRRRAGGRRARAGGGRRWRTRSGCRSTRPRCGRSPAGRWPRRARASARRPSWRAPRPELDACGALRYRDEAEHELRRLGHRRLHRRTRAGKADASGVESLTERELQIARLVVDRKTNSQIAAELFLSPKTVETHIRNLFHKLDVSSRVEVARVVERADQGP